MLDLGVGHYHACALIIDSGGEALKCWFVIEKTFPNDPSVPRDERSRRTRVPLVRVFVKP